MKHLIALLFLVLLLPAPAVAADFPARVVGVSDGDTLTVLTADKRQVTVRLFGIDAPETDQDYGTQAKKACSELAFGEEVTVREKGKDRYGRTVAEVIFWDGQSLSRELVDSGHAWWFSEYAPHDRELERMEENARAANRGLWSQPNPVPPWEWRKPKVTDTGQLDGNVRSRLYHSPKCRIAGRINQSVKFATKVDAEAAGHRMAGDWR